MTEIKPAHQQLHLFGATLPAPQSTIIDCKHKVRSELLQRNAHADVVIVGEATKSKFLIVLFGGSGIDDEKYQRRSEHSPSYLRPYFTTLLRENPTLAFTFAHVCAPPDFPIRRMQQSPEIAERWANHIWSELLAPWRDMPYIVGGFSGGVALAFSGLHADPRCIGGFSFVADALSPDFKKPSHWKSPLQMYSGRNDPVATHDGNRETERILAKRGAAQPYTIPNRPHRLGQYVTHDALSRVIQLGSMLTSQGESQ